MQICEVQCPKIILFSYYVDRVSLTMACLFIINYVMKLKVLHV